MKITRRILLLTLAVCAAAASPAAAQTWAPADSATIRPGNQTLTEGAQCTSNFVFSDGANVYLGQAAHCAGTGGATETNGCEAGSLPLGTPVEIEDATQPGTLVYSSWIAMQQAGETDANTCGFNDFALVQVHPADAGSVNPTIPFWGGPTGTATTTAAGDKVLSYGNSSLRFGAEPLKPKEGVSLGTSRGGWNHQVYTVTPGIPGDSGSAFIDRQGRAFGTLSTLQAAPAPASNGVSDVSREIGYMLSHGGPQVTLANGTEPFEGPLLP
ncbi:MAG TPA: hypothetical protein VHG69_11230 [Thermoleophilaceae bacterium]|nr:hypothetical protein [Thermoleophilaceae bacterium]